MIKRQITSKEALVKAEDLCARSERCRSEIAEKLRQWGIGSSDAEKILNSLEERRFIDERRYAEAFVRSKFLFSHWGRVKISQALAVKRIPRDFSDEALDLIDEQEYRSAVKSVVKRKAATMDLPLSHEDRAKVARFAMSRGFEWKYIKDALARLDDDDVDDNDAEDF